jgi:hypothetical protein
MTDESATIQVLLDDTLPASKQKATSMSLPVAVHHMLDLLAEEATAVKATRAEIVGMLIASTTLSSDQLERELVAYRKMKVRDVLSLRHEPLVEGDSNVVDLPVRSPGRPRQALA